MIGQNIWLGLNPETRRSIALLLEIPRSGGMVVEGNRIVNDGYTAHDLAHLTLPRLQEFMQMPDEDNFYTLLGILVERIENPITIELPAPETLGSKFCEYCDSKGVRHLKTCTRELINN